MKKLCQRFALGVSLLITISACTMDSPGNAETKDSPTPKGTPVAGKPQPPLAIDFSLAKTPAVGEEMLVHLTVGFTNDAKGEIELTIHADAGLNLDAAASKTTLTIDKSGDQASYQLGVTPAAEGLYYVHVSAAGSGMTRTVSIPVPVGDSTTRPATAHQQGELKKDAEGNDLHVMPIEESREDR